MKKIYQIGPGKELKGGISTVIKNINKSDIIKKEYKIINIETIGKNKFSCFFLSLFKALKIEDGSILHFHVASNGSFIRKYIIFKISNKSCKKIFHLHGGGFIQFYRNSNGFVKKCIRDMINNSDLVINVSNYMKNELESEIDIDKGKSIKIYNGINYTGVEKTFEDKENIIVFMGKIVAYKGIYDLLEIIYKIKNELKEKKWKVKIAGEGEIDKVKSILKKRHLLDVVEVVGWVSGNRKKELLEESKIFIIPSHVESFGIVAIEAMEKGNAIIASDAGALPEIIKNKKNGYIIKNNNYNDYKNAILNLINSESLIKEMYLNNIEEAKKYSINEMNKNIIKQYKRL